MDAKQTLDQIYEDPPQPHFYGYFCGGLQPLILYMKCVGMYFDGHHFPEARRLLYKNCVTHDLNSDCTKPVKPFKNQVNAANENEHNKGNSWLTGMDSNSTTEIEHEHGHNTTLKPFNVSEDFLRKLVKFDTGIVDEKELIDLLSPLRPKEGFDEDINEPKHQHSRVTCSLPSFVRTFFTGRVYVMIVMFILWANTFRCVMYIGDDRVNLVAIASSIMWYTLCSLNLTVFLFSCWKKSHFSAFFINWALFYKDMTTRRLGLRGVASNANVKWGLAVFSGITIFNMTAGICIMTLDDSLSAGWNNMFYIDGQRSILAIILSSFVCFFCSSAWVSPVTFIVVMCHHIVVHFGQFKDILKLHIEAAGNRFPPKFSELRERHLVMCNLVAIFDKYMSKALAVIYSMNIIIACFLLYQTLNLRSASIAILCIAGAWVCASLIIMGVVTCSASSVNTAMHSVLYELQTVQTTCITFEQHTQLQLFMSKVNGPDLGFSVLGFLTVKKGLILTLYGLYITYALVLLQL